MGAICLNTILSKNETRTLPTNFSSTFFKLQAQKIEPLWETDKVAGMYDFSVDLLVSQFQQIMDTKPPYHWRAKAYQRVHLFAGILGNLSCLDLQYVVTFFRVPVSHNSSRTKLQEACFGISGRCCYHPSIFFIPDSLWRFSGDISGILPHERFSFFIITCINPYFFSFSTSPCNTYVHC